jgi:hypothetical protein
MCRPDPPFPCQPDNRRNAHLARSVQNRPSRGRRLDENPEASQPATISGLVGRLCDAISAPDSANARSSSRRSVSFRLGRLARVLLGCFRIAYTTKGRTGCPHTAQPEALLVVDGKDVTGRESIGQAGCATDDAVQRKCECPHEKDDPDPRKEYAERCPAAGVGRTHSA